MEVLYIYVLFMVTEVLEKKVGNYFGDDTYCSAKGVLIESSQQNGLCRWPKGRYVSTKEPRCRTKHFGIELSTKGRRYEDLGHLINNTIDPKRVVINKMEVYYSLKKTEWFLGNDSKP